MDVSFIQAVEEPQEGDAECLEEEKEEESPVHDEAELDPHVASHQQSRKLPGSFQTSSQGAASRLVS